MELVYKLRQYFASLQEGKLRKLPDELLGADFPGWVIKVGREVGVGIVTSEEVKVNEKFTNVNLYTKNLIVEGEYKNLLLLTCESEERRYEFASIAAVFLDPGKDGADRAQVTTEPLLWWKKWKDLLGNASVEKSVQGVFGELLTLKHLALKSKPESSPLWKGPKGGSIDIEYDNRNYEVKTTTNKYENIITVNSQFQLSSIFNADLFFIRVEETSQGTSINHLCDDLVNLGFSKDDLEDGLKRLGLPENTSARDKEFLVLESRMYNTAGLFPTDNLKQALGDAATHILQIQYKLDLTGLEHEDIKM
ncbi:PD-(D/E)XK motif protein [Halobacillus yeomjeoni]|uniref:PD-(D/E)XK motif protein n=1 Tax=Halobacillus yeomjeoni TaxID=311194 RepID=A0A931MWI1_9BACI|nr:PD-(D/E)XK motif protein [Halobacillus yeomjeoni]MBH0231374.1 PD-(D/E)XK motif protein [Halobacillus yeomjeoni]